MHKSDLNGMKRMLSFIVILDIRCCALRYSLELPDVKYICHSYHFLYHNDEYVDKSYNDENIAGSVPVPPRLYHFPKPNFDVVQRYVFHNSTVESKLLSMDTSRPFLLHTGQW